jgi:festuclavine dehydrogenase
VSNTDIAAILSSVLGRTITHVTVGEEQLAARLQDQSGMPKQIAETVARMDTSIQNGAEERLNDVVLDLTGKSPKSFRAFAEANKDVWAAVNNDAV